MPIHFHIIQDKDGNYFYVDLELKNAWDLMCNYIGELECKEVNNGWEFKLKEETT